MRSLVPPPDLFRRRWLVTAAFLLATVVYFYGLDSRNIPKNGDEYPYSHITRLTAASDHLLPLRSDLDGMRNTKPPLLFWQGIYATNWGKGWTLWNLRYPSVLYTLFTALLVALLGRRISGRTETGVMAALAFLAFFGTYRYGRPFLTDPALVFWFMLPFFTLLRWRPASFDSRIVVPLWTGLALGMGLLYKSFAVALPACLALAAWYLQEREYRLREFLARDSWKVAVSGGISLLLFALWFLLDPDPRAVWREFVVGENIGKFDPRQGGYLAQLLWGSSSVWSLFLAWLANAGLLLFPLAGLFWAAFRDRRRLSREDRLLWTCVIVLFIAFCLPSQRSGRYLLATMPMLSLLLVSNWEKIHRALFATTLVCSGLVAAAALFLSLRLQAELGGVPLYAWHHWLLLAVLAALLTAGIGKPRYTRPIAVVAALLVNLLFASLMAPLDGPLGNYSPETLARVRGRHVRVPCDFRAKDEGHRFLLPGADVSGYRTSLHLDLPALAERYPLFAVQLPIAKATPGEVSAACPDCRVIGERLEVRGRQSGKEIREALIGGKLFEMLFARELLIESPRGAADNAARRRADECR